MNKEQTRAHTAWLVGFIICLCLFPALILKGETAKEILDTSGIKGGLIVHLGCGNAALTAQLRAGEQYFVHGLDMNRVEVATARNNIIEQGIYGPVSVDQWDGEHLPYADNLVNLIIADEPENISETELLRALAPEGIALLRQNGQWKKVSKPRPAEMDEWTHYFHGPDGNPVAKDSIVGPPERLQWVGSPRWSRHHDHMASMTSLVSTGGRLFYIFDEGPTVSIQLPSQWRLIARDAFNGIILWKRNINQWNTQQYPLKSGPAHLLRRLVAVGQRVYVTLGIDAPVTALDAASGKTVLTYQDSEYTREIVVSEGVAFFVTDNSRSILPDWRRKDTYVWANTQKANPGWGWKGTPRKILAYEADSGNPLWQAEAPVAPCSMAVDTEHLVFHDGNKLVCLDRRHGNTLWESEPTPTGLPVHTSTGPRVLIYKDVVLLAANTGKMSGFSAKDGKKLWEQTHRPSGHQSLKDLIVINGLVWTGSIAGNQNDGAFAGYDAITGNLAREFPADVKVHWFHHRCYPSKATSDYLITARNGTEFIDLTAQHWKPHHWVRGGCIYGVMPCNGMTYAPMDSCGCQLEAKLTGFKALASGPGPQITKAVLTTQSRLERGPAYGKPTGPSAGTADWPTYRHDESRSGATSVTVSGELKQNWQAKLSGRLSAPTIAAGKLFVASIDTHTLYALDAQTGRKLWSYTTGGRIDSPPTYYKGLTLFGSVDGYVYALRAGDGILAWRFRAAPVDRRMMAWEQLESAWPVHGSVLVHNNVLYCTAGRNMYIDGGIHFLRLDPATGKLLGETVMNDKDPETGEDMHLAYLKKTQGNNMPVAHSDILTCDGRHIWMRSQKITFDGKRLEIGLENVEEQNPEDFHIFCQNGFLDDSYFFRSYWTFGRRVTGGYGGWYKAGRLVPSGRILCFDEKNVYGFGRKPEYMVNSSVLEYRIFSADKVVTRQAIERIGKAERAMNTRSSQKNANSSDWRLRSFFPDKDLSAATFQWTLEQPALIARAMTAAADKLFIAGPPDLLDERQAFHSPDDPEVQAKLKRQAEALDGRAGGQLWVLTKADGKLVSRFALDTIPVFDGMAAAGESLYITTVDGRVMCLTGKQGAPLRKAGDKPSQVIWDKPEDPGYLLAPEENKEGDFDKVARCQVVSSKLGYRLRSTGKKQVGIAVKELDRPITGSVTFKTSMKAVPSADGLLSNGYLAFGNGAMDTRLIKCGARLKAKQISIVQGPLLKGKPSTTKINIYDNQSLEIVVKVNLKTQKIIYTANGVVMETEIQSPLHSITHVGYVINSALIDFAPVEVE
ncbi:MAG: PQQ-binding-like beta-propeller repeat protein [Planctomycetes bacterium]|nr:PQQ-binding-like beta-propeller repeat protein [Planctomycetota bacterium]